MPEAPELDDDGFLVLPASAGVPPASVLDDAGLLAGSAVEGCAGSVGSVVVVSAPAPVPVSVAPTAHATSAAPATSASTLTPSGARWARTWTYNAFCIVGELSIATARATPAAERLLTPR